MKKLIFSSVLAFALACGCPAFSAGPRFVKLSDHCYYMQAKESGENVAAVVTNDGILLLNPPPEPELGSVIEALKAVSPKPVRWVVLSEPGMSRNMAAGFYAEQKPLFLTSARQKGLFPKLEKKVEEAVEGFTSSGLIFDRQMRVFPSDLEVRLIALQHKARTGGDIVVFIPAEKVLFVGALYEAARYPDIDGIVEGSAMGWFDGLKQTMDAVPVLKSAIPQAKLDPKLDKDKKPEEFITVLSAHGEPSNLQNMKDLLESTQKLRSEVAKFIKRGRNCSDFLASPVSDPYRSYSNLESFATQLFAETK
jgi:hypothetical protein